MLLRTVRMTFKPEEVATFLSIFESSKSKIRNFEGCLHLELHQDYHQPNIYSTYSKWEDDLALDRYRTSALFKEVWSKTKVLFEEKPIAFSQKQHTIVS